MDHSILTLGQIINEQIIIFLKKIYISSYIPQNNKAITKPCVITSLADYKYCAIYCDYKYYKCYKYSWQALYEIGVEERNFFGGTCILEETGTCEFLLST